MDKISALSMGPVRTLKVVGKKFTLMWPLLEVSTHPLGWEGTLSSNNTVLYDNALSLKKAFTSTGCGRKNSPIWEANKFRTKEDTANVFFYFWKVHRMPFYINVFWTKHHSGGSLEYWYTDVTSLGSCPWPWESFQVWWQQLPVICLLQSFQS